VTSSLTSSLAYAEHTASGKALTQKERVYRCILRARRPISRMDIHYMTGIRLASVCGRVNELLEEKPARIKVSESVKRDPESQKYVECLVPVAQLRLL